MSLRRELLERELDKLGFRKSGAGTGTHEGGNAQPQQQQQQQQQQPQPASGHPRAEGQEAGGSAEHGD